MAERFPVKEGCGSSILLDGPMKTKGPKLYKNLKTSGEVQEADFKFLQEKPDGDANFSVQRNRQVIADSIKKNEKLMIAKQKAHDEALAERTDAAASFLKALVDGKYFGVNSHTAATRFFGRRELARLRGEEIKKQMMEQMQKNARDLGMN